MTKNILITWLFIASLSSCKKSNISEPAKNIYSSPMEILSAHRWMLDTALTIRYFQRFIDTTYDVVNPCHIYYVGDTSHFFSNGYYWLQEDLCSSIAPSINSEPFYIDTTVSPHLFIYSTNRITYQITQLDAENFDIKVTWITSAADSTSRILHYSPL